MSKKWLAVTCVVFVASVATLGCGPKADQAAAPTKDGHADGHHSDDEHAEDGKKHGEWWCDDHGVLESICAQCYPKIAAEFQKKGDWCKIHHRPDSQCFVCHPELEKKFADQYVAKYGKQPPPRKEGGHDDKDHDHHDEEHEKPKS